MADKAAEVSVTVTPSRPVAGSGAAMSVLPRTRRAVTAGRAPLPSPPTEEEKTCYVDRQLGYLTLVVLIGYSSIVISQAAMEVRYGTWVLAPWTAFTVVYLAVSLFSNFTGRDFDLSAHRAKVGAW